MMEYKQNCKEVWVYLQLKDEWGDLSWYRIGHDKSFYVGSESDPKGINLIDMIEKQYDVPVRIQLI